MQAALLARYDEVFVSAVAGEARLLLTVLYPKVLAEFAASADPSVPPLKAPLGEDPRQPRSPAAIAHTSGGLSNDPALLDRRTSELRAALAALPRAPDTLQRLCEVLLTPRAHTPGRGALLRVLARVRCGDFWSTKCFQVTIAQ